MYNLTTIRECLSGLIGFRQTAHPDYPQIDQDLTMSESETYYQDVHPLISIENIVAVAPRFDEYTEPDKAALVNKFLKDTVNASVHKVVRALCNRKKLSLLTKTILQDTQLYFGTGLYSDKIIKQSRFVGFEISLKTGSDLAAIISHIGTQFDFAQPQTLNMYLFQAGNPDPVKTFPLTLAKAVYFEWSEVDKIPMINGPFYLGYYEDELSGQALRRSEDLTRRPCMTCSDTNIKAYNTWSPHVSIRPFYLSLANYDHGQLWEPGLLNYVNDTNWGLNLKLSVRCDLSDFICRNKDVFTDALGLQVAVDLLTQMAYSLRDNQDKHKVSQLAFAALENSQTGTPGLKTELNQAIEVLDIDTSGFDSRCLSCGRKQGIRYSAA